MRLHDGEGGCRELDCTDIRECETDSNQWLWVHLNYSEPAVQEWMYEHSGLSTITAEAFVSRLAEQTNKRMYILSVVAAIFLPLSFLTGLLGINVGGIPGAESPLGFPVVIIIMLIIALGLWFFFRWRRWF